MVEERTLPAQIEDRSPLTIDYLRDEHIKALMEIEVRSFGAPWSEWAYRNEMNNAAAVYLVGLMPDGRVAGYAGAWIVLDEAHVTTIAIHPDLRGRKLGKAILVALLDATAERGAIRATLEVRPSNTAALEMYRKFGFRPVGRRKSYYSDNREDAIIMWLNGFDVEQYVREAEATRALFRWAEPPNAEDGG
jgi:ribosomal-protein-alanine N-acetyltransferase